MLSVLWSGAMYTRKVFIFGYEASMGLYALCSEIKNNVCRTYYRFWYDLKDTVGKLTLLSITPVILPIMIGYNLTGALYDKVIQFTEGDTFKRKMGMACAHGVGYSVILPLIYAQTYVYGWALRTWFYLLGGVGSLLTFAGSQMSLCTRIYGESFIFTACLYSMCIISMFTMRCAHEAYIVYVKKTDDIVKLVGDNSQLGTQITNYKFRVWLCLRFSKLFDQTKWYGKLLPKLFSLKFMGLVYRVWFLITLHTAPEIPINMRMQLVQEMKALRRSNSENGRFKALGLFLNFYMTAWCSNAETQNLIHFSANLDPVYVLLDDVRSDGNTMYIRRKVLTYRPRNDFEQIQLNLTVNRIVANYIKNFDSMSSSAVRSLENVSKSLVALSHISPVTFNSFFVKKFLMLSLKVSQCNFLHVERTHCKPSIDELLDGTFHEYMRCHTVRGLVNLNNATPFHSIWTILTPIIISNNFCCDLFWIPKTVLKYDSLTQVNETIFGAVEYRSLPVDCVLWNRDISDSIEAFGTHFILTYVRDLNLLLEETAVDYIRGKSTDLVKKGLHTLTNSPNFNYTLFLLDSGEMKVENISKLVKFGHKYGVNLPTMDDVMMTDALTYWHTSLKLLDCDYVVRDLLSDLNHTDYVHNLEVLSKMSKCGMWPSLDVTGSINPRLFTNCLFHKYTPDMYLKNVHAKMFGSDGRDSDNQNALLRAQFPIFVEYLTYAYPTFLETLCRKIKMLEEFRKEYSDGLLSKNLSEWKKEFSEKLDVDCRIMIMPIEDGEQYYVCQNGKVPHFVGMEVWEEHKKTIGIGKKQNGECCVCHKPMNVTRFVNKSVGCDSDISVKIVKPKRTILQND